MLCENTMIPSSYPSAIRSILVASGCDTALVPPPREYETTDNPIPMDEAIFEYDTSKLFNAAGFSPEATSELDKYWHVRRFYMGQLKILSRNDNEDPTYEKSKQQCKKEI